MDKYFDKGENKCIEPVEGIAVRCLLSGIVLSGSLVITNFRLLYVSDSSLPIKEQSSISTEKVTFLITIIDNLEEQEHKHTCLP
jgi:hypothetical protein